MDIHTDDDFTAGCTYRRIQAGGNDPAWIFDDSMTRIGFYPLIENRASAVTAHSIRDQHLEVAVHLATDDVEKILDVPHFVSTGDNDRY
jgi:hypothetical protein